RQAIRLRTFFIDYDLLFKILKSFKSLLWQPAFYNDEALAGTSNAGSAVIGRDPGSKVAILYF
nr:hypothetical protein [Chitinophagaceae bacterium]HPN58850.1 hypothetical protein [Chitinophagaceae bacterium]